MTRDQGKHNTALAVIAGLTRNLQSEKDTSLHSGDGGCSSAMTVIALVCISSANVSKQAKHA